MNKMLRIKSDGMTGRGAKITTADGSEVPGVTSCDISLKPDMKTFATLDIMLASVDVLAHPLLGLETVRAAAKFYGYELVQDSLGYEDVKW